MLSTQSNKIILPSFRIRGHHHRRNRVVAVAANTIYSGQYRCKTTTSIRDDVKYQLLQQSKLPTMYFQPSLPRLPIPPLEKTCQRYLDALRPLLIDESYRKSESVVKRFKTTIGPQLQKMLKDHDNSHKETSYISEPWFDMYLRDRIPLPINYNPLMALKNDPRKEYNDQLIRTTNLVISSLRFMRSLRAECLEPEVYHLNPKKSDTDQFRLVTKLAPTSIATYVAYMFKAFPLDMSQFSGLFGATRIPELDKDRIFRDTESKHIMLIRNGNIYAVDVLDEAGYIEPPSVIFGRIKRVLVDETPNDEFALGVLTASERNSWATLRHHLTKLSKENEKKMKLIDSALFNICLDDLIYDDDKPIPAIKTLLAGDGTNRWFDKSVSLIIGKDGTAAVNFEHSWGDGVAVLRYFNEIFKDSTTAPLIHPNSTPTIEDDIDTKVRLIKLSIDDRMKEGISEARQKHNDVMEALDINFLRYDELNKKILKKHGVSPDSIMQLSFQLAYKKVFNGYVGTYESCSTAAFRHGRTETMRPCTIATKEFCEAVLRKDPPSTAELQELIKKCSALHGKLTKEAAMGQGFDRHLFGLSHIAEKNDLKKPALYDDPSYQFLNYHTISTSTLGSPALLAGAFGPVVEDGLGIGYNISDDMCGSIVSSYKNKRDGSKFVEGLKDSFVTIKNILNAK